jgi:hypothetical protein
MKNVLLILIFSVIFNLSVAANGEVLKNSTCVIANYNKKSGTLMCKDGSSYTPHKVSNPSRDRDLKVGDNALVTYTETDNTRYWKSIAVKVKDF